MEAKPELKYIFENINDWLKFAEAKHAGLIIFNSGMAIGILSSYGNFQHYFSKLTIFIGIICFGISVFLSIISQFPVTQNVFFNKKTITNANLYFFGHLAHFDHQDFIAELKKVDTSFVATKFDSDLINQILVNARISKAKFSFFKYASYLTAFGLGIIGFSSIYKVIWHF